METADDEHFQLWLKGYDIQRIRKSAAEDGLSPKQYVQTLSRFLDDEEGQEAHFEKQTAAMVPFTRWTHIPQYVSLASTVGDWSEVGSVAQRLQNLISERKDSGTPVLLQFRRIGGRLVIFNYRLTGRSRRKLAYVVRSGEANGPEDVGRLLSQFHSDVGPAASFVDFISFPVLPGRPRRKNSLHLVALFSVPNATTEDCLPAAAVPKYLTLVLVINDWKELVACVDNAQRAISERHGSSELLRFRRIGGRLTALTFRVAGDRRGARALRSYVLMRAETHAGLEDIGRLFSQFHAELRTCREVALLDFASVPVLAPYGQKPSAKHLNLIGLFSISGTV